MAIGYDSEMDWTKCERTQSNACLPLTIKEYLNVWYISTGGFCDFLWTLLKPYFKGYGSDIYLYHCSKKTESTLYTMLYYTVVVSIFGTVLRQQLRCYMHRFPKYEEWIHGRLKPPSHEGQIRHIETSRAYTVSSPRHRLVQKQKMDPY